MTDMEMESAPKRRVMDTSAGEAKRAVAEIVSSLRPRREKVTLIAARAERPLPVEERQKLLRECEEVAGAAKKHEPRY